MKQRLFRKNYRLENYNKMEKNLRNNQKNKKLQNYNLQNNKKLMKKNKNQL